VCPSDSFSILNIGRLFLSVAVAGYRYEIMAPPGEGVGIGSANPSESASNPGWKERLLVAPLYQLIIGCGICEATFLQYPGMHGERHP
jgi:hypothetical protein